MISKKRILGIIYEPGNFQTMRLVAEQGNTSGDFDMILWSPYALENEENYRYEAEAIGSIYIAETNRLGGLADIHSPLSSWLSARPIKLKIAEGQKRVFTWPKKANIDRLFSSLDEITQRAVLCAEDICERRTRFCEDWLVRLGIDTILFSEDNIERDSFAWIAAARRRGLRTVVTSYGALSSKEAENAYLKSADHQISGDELSLVKMYLSKWLREGEEYSITRLPLIDMLGREKFGMSPFDPWLVNTNGVTAIALESQEMLKRYKKHGFANNRLYAIGNPLLDRLFSVKKERESLKKHLADKYNHNENAPLIVVGLPPNQFSSRTSCFESYEKLIENFSLLPSKNTDALVIVSPHPNISDKDKDHLISLGINLENKSIAELLPAADLYIACVSSTIKWALGLGIPVIDFDCYCYRYSDYIDLPQVRSVDTVSGLLSNLERWTKPSERKKWELLASEDRLNWGQIDGNATKRLVDLCLRSDLSGNDDLKLMPGT